MNKSDYLLHLADNALILGQRNAEWCGQGPILEEDIAMANISLDLIGQARLLYQLAAERMGNQMTEDHLAYFRNEREYRNYTLLELPHHTIYSGYMSADKDYSVTIVRNFLYASLMLLVWDGLQKVNDQDLAAIAEKSLKEVRYHARHSADWLLRFGRGTEISKEKAQAAMNHLLPYTQEFWTQSEMERRALAAGMAIDMSSLKNTWMDMVQDKCKAAGLDFPVIQGYVTQGKEQLHSEHLGYVLAEMQSLARSIPAGVW